MNYEISKNVPKIKKNPMTQNLRGKKKTPKQVTCEWT